MDLITPIDVDVSWDGGTATVAVAGELDLSTSATLADLLAPLVAGGATAVDLDLGLVGFMDSTALRVLLSALTRAEARGIDLRLTSTSRQVERVLQVSGTSRLLGPDRPASKP